MNKIHFEKLTPFKETDLKVYNDALQFVFDNHDITNIAISGAYGAGKSSVVESYKKNNKNLNFLHISLANFQNNENQDDKNKDTPLSRELVLEGKILNQLMHQIDIDKIPQTNFKIKQKVSEKSIIIITSMAVAFIGATLHIKYYSQWSSFINTLSNIKYLKFLSITATNISLLISGILVTLIGSIACYKVIKTLKNKSILKRLKFQGNEIEIFEKNDESYFDKYLNEVVYLFDNADVDVIVFEDMDRYNANEIFQRLREVNKLVNCKSEKEYKNPLRFLYLIRDDLFISKDRTKFFDFIMPVVPVIDNSNSYDQFISHLKKGGVFEKFDEHFLQSVSLYVDDMRILKNIYNEFIIYYTRIGTTEQDYNKLLAIIIYKNIFPRDFSDTQINIGFVSTVFNSKEDFIKNNINQIDKEIGEIKETITKCQKEHLENINELNKLFTTYHFGGGTSIDNNNDKYIEREKRIKLIESNQIDNMKYKINQLELEKNTMKNKKVREIITRDNVDTIFNICYKNFTGQANDFKEIKESPYFDLIRYLIWNGHIDESYQDYMTYFYPNSLTQNDKIFLRSVSDKKAKDWNYKINNTKLVLSKLRQEDFNEIETLNFDLFTYIISTEAFNNSHLIGLIGQLKEMKQFTFINEYTNTVDDLSKFINVINNYWESFLYETFNQAEFSYEKKKKFILETLYCCNNETITTINKDDFLASTIACDDKFLDIESPNIEKLLSKFLKLNIKFKNFDFEKLNRQLFGCIYKNNLYALTFDNISLMLDKIHNFKEPLEIKQKNYSLIIMDEISTLSKYVHENINQYIQLVIDNCDEIITDSQQAVLKLINNKEIEFTKKKDYLKYLQTELEDLKDIEDINLWDTFLQRSLVRYSENNILYYYFKSNNGLNEVLVNFINGNSKKLEFCLNNINEVFGEDSAESLFDGIVVCETLNNNKYKNIISELGYEYTLFNIEGLSHQKIKILIDLGLIKMTAENIVFMRNEYSSQFSYLLEKNIEDYISTVIDIEPITYDELINMLSSNIDDSFKIDLISHTNKNISAISPSYSETVKEYILKNNFKESDLNLLIDKFSNQSNILKAVIKQKCIEYFYIITNEEFQLPIELLKALLLYEDLLVEDKVRILIPNIARLSITECEDCIKNINSKEYEKLFGNGRPRLEITDVNMKLLEAFKNKHWISDFKEENGKFRISRRGCK